MLLVRFSDCPFVRSDRVLHSRHFIKCSIVGITKPQNITITTAIINTIIYTQNGVDKHPKRGYKAIPRQ